MVVEIHKEYIAESIVLQREKSKGIALLERAKTDRNANIA